jgi:hypothetical protein
MTEEEHAAALMAAAIDARDCGAPQVAVSLCRALLDRYPLSTEATEALQYLQGGRVPRDVWELRDDGA